jgi:hypothetical protein
MLGKGDLAPKNNYGVNGLPHLFYTGTQLQMQRQVAYYLTVAWIGDQKFSTNSLLSSPLNIIPTSLDYRTKEMAAAFANFKF